MFGILPLALTETITRSAWCQLNAKADEIVHLHAQSLGQAAKSLPSRFDLQALFDMRDRVAGQIALVSDVFAGHVCLAAQLFNSEPKP